RERAGGVALEGAEEDVERAEAERVRELAAGVVGLAASLDAGVLGGGEELPAQRAEAAGIEVARAEQVGAVVPVRREVQLAVGGAEHEVAADGLGVAFLQVVHERGGVALVERALGGIVGERDRLQEARVEHALVAGEAELEVAQAGDAASAEIMG